MGHKDLRLGQIVYILVFYNISFSWLLPLDGFQFIFTLRDSENDLYAHILSKYEPTNFLLFLFFFNMKFNATVGLNSIYTAYNTSKQYTRQLL